MRTFADMHRPDVTSGCSVWTGKRSQTGWGVWPTPRDDRPLWVTVEPLAVEWVAAWRLGADHPDELPKGLVVSTTCGDRLCVADGHVIVGSTTVEAKRVIVRSTVAAPTVRRGIPLRTRSTHCGRGHAYAVYGRLRADGYLQCRPCHAAANAAVRRYGRRRKPGDPCLNGHPSSEQATGPSGYRWCVACRRESTIRRNKVRQLSPECLRGHLRSEHGYRDSSDRQRCRKCEQNRRR